MTFEYTHSDDDVDSSAVYEAYYNAKHHKLAVVLSGGHGYVYSNVPLYVYHELVGAKSPGAYYALTVKRKYGQAENIGYVGYENTETFVEYKGVPAADMTGVDISSATPVISNTYVNLAPVTDKGLTYASDAVVDGVPVSVKFRHTIKFDVVGGNKDKSYTVEAGSVPAAVEALREIADMLGLEVKVKEVTVYFE